jgi:hypothetical protein
VGKIVSQYDGTQVLTTSGPVTSQVFTPNAALAASVPGYPQFWPGGWLDEVIVTYDATAPDGIVWVYLIGNTQGVVPADGWSPGAVPPAWTPSTRFPDRTYITNPMDGAGNGGAHISWCGSGGGMTGTGLGPIPQQTLLSRQQTNLQVPPVYQSTDTDGSETWTLMSDPNTAPSYAGGLGTVGPCLLELPVPINHTNGFPDVVAIVESRPVKYFGGVLAVVSTTQWTLAQATTPYAAFSFKGA